MAAPAASKIGQDLDIHSAFLLSLSLSIFILGYVVAPLVLGPLSEIYGRTRILFTTNVVFLVFNAACGSARSAGELIAFRFIAGLGGSAPLSVSKLIPCFQKLFGAKKRSWAVGF